MSPEFDQQNQVFHGSQFNIGVMHGDIVFRRIELQAALREAFDFLIEDRRAAFGGRKKELAQINEFLRQEPGGFLAITANAGFGKTSLMAELAGGQPDAFAYHFFNPLYERSLSEELFLRNVVQQMAAWHGEEGDLPVELDKLTALYHKYLDQELDETRILLFDGLDEVTRWPLAPYLQRRLPEKLHIIVTIRDVGQDWRQQYQFPADQLTHLPMGGLTTVDIQDVLAAAGGDAHALTGNEALIAEIGRVAAYDEAQSELGADPFYVAFLAEDLAAGAISPQELAHRPSGLHAYLNRWWKAIRAEAGDEATRDLFGTLAAALGRLTRADLEALNPSLVDEWAGDYFDEVLAGVRRFVTGDETVGYTFVHPRLQIYLRDPKRIKAVPAYTAKLLAYCAGWEQNRSAYVMRYAIEHLAAEQAYDDLINMIIDPAFREAQQQVLGTSQVTLDDLRHALEIALAQDDPLRILKIVAAYRDTRRQRPLTQALFDAVNMGFLDQALAIAGHYLPASDWPRMLYLYLAFEFAAAGDAVQSRRTARMGLQLPAGRMNALSDAFVSALARLLAWQTGEDPQIVVNELLPDANAAKLLAEYPPAPPLDMLERDELIAALEPQLAHFEQLAADGESEAVMSVIPMLEEEARSDWFYADDMRLLLRKLAADPMSWDYIERALFVILPNPYSVYRDIGLEAIGRAALAAPLDDPFAQSWLRALWQEMLLTALDAEGVSFTFDVPILLVGEAERRGMPLDVNLVDYADRALTAFDKWGTRMRAHSGRAADLFFAGSPDEADDLLGTVASEAHGYAGFATSHLIAVANRWYEIGRSQRVETPPLTPWDDRTLKDQLDNQVSYVRDAAFRDRLIALIAQYHAWREEPQAPSPADGLTRLRSIQDEYARDFYVDYLSARWSWPPDAPSLSGLKGLLPLVLDKGTLVDLVLARLLRAFLANDPQALDDAALFEAQLIASESLATGRPWEQIHGAQIG